MQPHFGSWSLTNWEAHLDFLILLSIVHHHRDSAADDRPPRQKSQASRRKPGVGGKTQKVH